MEAAVVSSPGLPAGTRFGDFVAVRPLAAGGMAELYLAAREREPAAPELAAIKRLLPHLGWDPEFVRMFLDEVRIAASLYHPNIVRVLDFGVGEGGHYLAMEYLHGHTLRDIQRSVRAAGPLPLGFSVSTVMEIAAGLHAAHEHRDVHGNPVEVVHRDVSPSNVMVTFEGHVKLLDFGIARVTEHTQLTKAGTLKGKMGYMSPEQCRGERVDRRSDVFGLGILLYELTVGRRAFYADNDYAVIGKVVDGDYLRPSDVVDGYPVPLEKVITRALQVEPGDRHPTAAALAEELARYMVSTRTDGSTPSRAALLHARFGSEPAPVVNSDDLRPAAAAPPPRKSGLWRWAGLGGIGVAIGVLGFVAGGLAQPDDGPAGASEPVVAGTPSPAPAAKTAPEPVPAPEPADATAPVVDPTKAELAASDSEAAALAEDDLLLVEDDEPSDGAGRSRRRPRPRRRPKGQTSASDSEEPTEPSGDPDALLPPTWREQ